MELVHATIPMDVLRDERRRKKRMALLTREQVVNCDDRRYEIVPVPEWAGEVRVRSLTEPEYHAYRDSVLTRAGKEREVNELTMRACLVAACVVDESGQTIFTVDDLTGGKDPTKAKSAHAIAIIWKKAAQLCGLDEDDIGEILKNCETGQRAGRS